MLPMGSLSMIKANFTALDNIVQSYLFAHQDKDILKLKTLSNNGQGV